MQLEDRLTPSFQPQPDFNDSNGVSRTHFGVKSGNDGANDVVVDDLGRIVMAGYAEVSDNTEAGHHTAMALVRLNADGTRDTSFGNNSKVIIDAVAIHSGSVRVGTSQATSLISTGNGYVVAGYANIDGDEDIVVASTIIRESRTPDSETNWMAFTFRMSARTIGPIGSRSTARALSLPRASGQRTGSMVMWRA